MCSRREADRLLKEGLITVNGNVAGIGDKVEDTDHIEINGTPIKTTNKLVYIVLNKPKGITSTTDESDPTNIVKFVNFPTRIFHIGRLDKDSEGLILLTNDGDIVNKILRSGNAHEKEYVVKVDKQITSSFLKSMASGVHILGKTTKPAYTEIIDNFHFRIVLTEGMNRQIRRMCTTFGYHVTRLMRVRIMNITTDGLAVGKWRYLTNEEIETVHKLTKESKKTI